MNVGVWLRNLGLGRYEKEFRKNKIDFDVLADLTEGDLEELDVPRGDRRRLLRAIAEIGAKEAPSIRSRLAPAALASAPHSLAQLDSAERRPITVMFCDLVGSTALAAALDVEDWRNLLSAYLDAASEAVTQLGGRVTQKLGDGLMALFGHPIAQENDSERAVRAALAIQLALAELNRKNPGRPELVARISVDSGAVVVDAAGEIFGDAPNVAARVQALAEPGTVLITARVHRQVAGLFVAEDRGPHLLEGALEPTTLFRIVRASGQRRGGARSLTPLVGRQEELALLRRRWERAARGEGQFVQIVGEPGIGKSRLIEEFRLKLGETPHTFVELSSSQLLQNTPLHPIAEWGRQRFGVDEPAARRLADLKNTLRLIGLDASEYAPLLAPLVDIPLSEERAAKLGPEELRRRQLAALTAWVLAGARSQPIALAFEDLHWADPTSLDLLQALAEGGAQAPLLILATARPEFRPPWSPRSHHSVISLTPLDRAGVARMVGELAARHALSNEVVERVSERTGGVPLFVEEVTRLLLERGEAGGLQAIPPTLQQSLAARLDRLGEAREVAQIGAVLGRDFTYALSRAVGGIGDPALRSALDRLADADLLISEGAGSQGSYRFKHALIQDAAYDSLLKSHRQALHRRAAEVLCDIPERAAAEPEIIAHHFAQAGLDELAIEWWGKAGDQALRRSAFQEAIAHLGRAIAMADRAAGPAPAASTSEVEASQRVKLQNDYAKAVLWSKGYAADEAKAAFERTSALATRAELPAEPFSALFGRYLWSWSRGEFRAARDIAERFLREAEAEGRIVEARMGHVALGQACMQLGDLREARTQLELALGRFEEVGSEIREKFGLDAGESARALLAFTMWLSGDLPRARGLIEEATHLAGELGHPPTAATVLIYKIAIETARNDFESVVVDAENFLRISQQHSMGYYLALSRLYLSLGRTRPGNTQRGADDFRKSLADYRDQGNRVGVPSFLGALARLEAAAQNTDRALVLIDEALAMSEEGGDRLYDSNLHRLRGNILLKRDPANPAPAEEAFKTSLAVAAQQGARSLELLAALALAKLYQATGRLVEAHAVLSPALEGFSPTPEMPVIAKVQALLAALAETEEVKAAAARRERRVKIQTAFGQALMWTKGFASEEAKDAFERTSALAARAELPAERFSALYGRFLWSWSRGKFRAARDNAERFLREAEAEGRIAEALVARLALGMAHMQMGDLREARTQLEFGLSRFEEPASEFIEKFGLDAGATARAVLAFALWLSGDPPRARELIAETTRLAAEIGHPPTTATVLLYKIAIETARNDFESVVVDAENFLRISQQHSMGYYLPLSRLYLSLGRTQLANTQRGLDDFRKSLADYRDQGNRVIVPGFLGALARLEAAAQNTERALALIDEALAMSEEGGDRLYDSNLHRLRGNILLKRDPANPAPAEEAFKTSLAVAAQQGARSLELLAALALAKLYQATDRLVEAHAVLAPALEGFSPTPEMPVIAKAQTLLAALAQTEEVRVAEAANSSGLISKRPTGRR
jgi:class 3 adenylate cyclase/tetratricopeptide (TPR) repeat protein